MANTSDIKNGMVLNHNNGLWQIVEFLHVNVAFGQSARVHWTQPSSTRPRRVDRP